MILAIGMHMPLVRRIVPVVLAVIVLAITIEMIRRRRLREEYAMLWLGTSGVLIVLAIFPAIPIWLQGLLQVNYLTIIVMACFLFLAMIVMHFAMVISRHAEQIRQLAERLALLQGDLEEHPPDGRAARERPAREGETDNPHGGRDESTPDPSAE